MRLSIQAHTTQEQRHSKTMMASRKKDTGCSKSRKYADLPCQDGVEEKRKRCRDCSSAKHFAKDCPTKPNDPGKRIRTRIKTLLEQHVP